MQAIDSAMRRLENSMAKRISGSREALEALSSRRVLQSATGFIEQRRSQVETLRVRLEAASGFASKSRSQLDNLVSRLDSALDAAMTRKKNEYLRAAAKLDALSPLKVLSRGYAIAMNEDGRAVKDSSGVRAGDKLTVRLASGALGCRVEDVYGKQD